jgi:hypothetical protein
MAKHRAYFDGKQYDGRPDFWTGGPQRRPLRERAPCVVYPLPKNAVREVSRFTFGDKRFPAVKVCAVDADNAVAGLAMSKEDAETVQTVITSIIKQTHLRVTMRSLQDDGLTVGSAVMVLGLKRGEFCVECPRAEHCLPTFEGDDPRAPVTRLVWCYEFEKVVQTQTGAIETRRFMFRREYDATNVQEFEPAPVLPGRPIEWRPLPPKPHGFSFCPVVWVCNSTEVNAGSFDGESLFEGVLDEFDALNFALSQRHRGITHFGVPQAYETGVDEDDGPQADGVQAGSRAYHRGDSALSPFGETDRSQAPARKVGPDQIWSYQGQSVNVGLVETTGKAFQVATEHVNDIGHRLKESMAVVLVNVAEVLGKGDMSAKFLELAYAPLLAHVDDLREFWWDRALRAVLVMALRMIVELGGRGVYIPRATNVARILGGRVLKTEQGPLWIAPELEPAWGDYFSPNNTDRKDAVEVAKSAREAGFISRRTGAAYVARFFGVTNVEKELEAIDAEKSDSSGMQSETSDGPNEKPEETEPSDDAPDSSKPTTEPEQSIDGGGQRSQQGKSTPTTSSSES